MSKCEEQILNTDIIYIAVVICLVISVGEVFAIVEAFSIAASRNQNV